MLTNLSMPEATIHPSKGADDQMKMPGEETMEKINMKTKNETDKQNPTTTVLVADKSGHSTLQLTKQETISMVEEQGNSWVFADGRMLDAAGLGEADWNAIGTVQLVP
ncbi:MAG TPA: hypothetical protein EYO42_04175, partial [Candidatus Poseidoniales archaeon]|nr:hypothetical protein [Candidatus Poseidoniales archaeon]